MTDSLSVAVERLRTSSERLNALSDSAAKTVRDTEAYLESLQLGIEAGVDLWTDYNSDNTYPLGEVRLSYTELENGKFRIAVVWIPEHVEHNDDITVKAWAECSREVKLRSFEKLPDLLIEIANKLDEKIIRAEQTVGAVARLIPTPMKKGA